MTATLSVEKSGRKCINLAAFSNGRIRSEHAGDLNIGILGRTDTQNPRLKEQKIMVAETKPMTYVGKNFGETVANTGKGLCKYYVGILDPDTGKMTVCDTEMFTMQPQIAGAQDEIDTAQVESTFTEKSDMLTAAFGSMKKKRGMESRKRQVVEENILKGVLNTAIDEGIEQAKAEKEKQADTPSESLVPPRDVEAKRVEGVYQLRDILSDDDMDALTNSAKVFVDSTLDKIKEWKEKEEYPLYVLSKLGMVSHHQERRIHKCKCLMYLSYMMHLYRMYYKDVRRKDPLPSSWPSSIRTKLYNNFTITVFYSSGKRERVLPSRQKDKLLSYILTLCLILDEFTVDMAELYKDLRLGPGKIATHFRILGCVVQKKTVDKLKQEFAVLKFPFKVAEESFQYKGKRAK